MCGIVGLFAKSVAIEAELGAHLMDMLAAMTDRGPDSAGFAICASDRVDMMKLTLRQPAESDPDALLSQLGVPNSTIVPRETNAMLSAPQACEAKARGALAKVAPQTVVVGAGTRMELYKEVGAPACVAAGFGLATMRGTHGISHTRMAIGSAVATAGTARLIAQVRSGKPEQARPERAGHQPLALAHPESGWAARAEGRRHGRHCIEPRPGRTTGHQHVCAGVHDCRRPTPAARCSASVRGISDAAL